MQAHPIKKFEELTIQDDFMFYKVMQKEPLIKARRAFNQRFLLTFSSCHKLYAMATYRKLMNL